MSRVASSSKGAKAKADRLFSLIVRARGECERCGTRDYTKLQCAHIISRHYSHTRTHLDNAFALCAMDHHYYTSNPVEFGLFVIEKRGEQAYAELLRRSQLRTKVDWTAEAARLTELWVRVNETVEE